MLILGIDPGYAIVGWGAVAYERNRFSVLGYGAITTAAHSDFNARLAEIYDGMQELFRRYPAEVMSIEKLFFNTNTTTAIGVAEARGCVLLAAQQAGAQVFEYTPLQVKQSVTGYGRAEKKQVMEMTRLMLILEKIPRPDDAADALALAICHAHSAGSLLMRSKITSDTGGR